MSGIGVFASGDVGAEVAGFVADEGALACLVLDSGNAGGTNGQIVRRAGPASTTFSSDSLYEPATLSALEQLDLDLIVFAW